LNGLEIDFSGPFLLIEMHFMPLSLGFDPDRHDLRLFASTGKQSCKHFEGSSGWFWLDRSGWPPRTNTCARSEAGNKFIIARIRPIVAHRCKGRLESAAPCACLILQSRKVKILIRDQCTLNDQIQE